MNHALEDLIWHKYLDTAAGWDGYLETPTGTVVAFLAKDGTVAPVESITGWNADE